jgi:hypothetical protein
MTRLRALGTLLITLAGIAAYWALFLVLAGE